MFSIGILTKKIEWEFCPCNIQIGPKTKLLLTKKIEELNRPIRKKLLHSPLRIVVLPSKINKFKV